MSCTLESHKLPCSTGPLLQLDSSLHLQYPPSGDYSQNMEHNIQPQVTSAIEVLKMVHSDSTYQASVRMLSKFYQRWELKILQTGASTSSLFTSGCVSPVQYSPLQLTPLLLSSLMCLEHTREDLIIQLQTRSLTLSLGSPGATCTYEYSYFLNVAFIIDKL